MLSSLKLPFNLCFILCCYSAKPVLSKLLHINFHKELEPEPAQPNKREAKAREARLVVAEPRRVEPTK